MHKLTLMFFLKVTCELPCHKSYYRERTKGSWTLSGGENCWPIADTTAEALKVRFILFSLIQSESHLSHCSQTWGLDLTCQRDKQSHKKMSAHLVERNKISFFLTKACQG